MSERAQILIKATDQTAGAFSSVQSHFRGVSSTLRSLAPQIAAALSIGGIVAFAKSAIDAGDAMNDMSQRTGLSVESLSKWQFVAQQSGATLESIQPGLKTLAQNLESASRGLKEQEDAFARLGVPVKDSAGNLRALDAVMLDIAEKFQSMPDGTQKTALAVRVFGKAGQELIPTLNQGKDGIADLMATAERLGVVMSSQAAAAADEFNDSIGLIKTSAGALRVEFLNYTAPAISLVAKEMADATKEGGALAGIFRGMATSAALLLVDTRNAGARVIELEDKLGKLKAMRDELSKPTTANKINDIIFGDVFDLNVQIGLMEKELGLLKKLQTAQAETLIKSQSGLHAPVVPVVPTGNLGEDAEKARKAAEASAKALRALINESDELFTKDRDNTMEATRLHQQADRERAGSLAKLIEESNAMFEDDRAATIARREEMAAKEEEMRTSRFTAVFDSLQSENALIEQDFAQRSLALKDWIRDRDDTLLEMRDKGALDDQQFNQKRIEANAQFYAAMKTLDVQYGANKLKLKSVETQRLQAISDSARKGELAGIAGLFAEAVPLMQSKSRTMFEIGKGAALASATVSMFSSIASALETKPFFPVGLAMGALALAKGIINIQGIKAAQFSGGGTVGTGTFSASPSTGLPVAPTSFEAPPSPLTQQTRAFEPTTVHVSVLGESEVVSMKWVRESLIPMLNNAAADRFRIIIN